MIIHTVVNPEHIFYKKPETKRQAVFSTDPYFYLKTDLFYRKNVMRK